MNEVFRIVDFAERAESRGDFAAAAVWWERAHRLAADRGVDLEVLLSV